MSRAPYKYLDYYTSADADLFFGREKETQMMVGEILSSRLLVLFARSGSGKTSLINAGVVPELKRRGYETLYVRFESDPLTSLQNAAREQLQHASAANDLHGLLQNVTAARQKPLVVFLDQFEEFFLVFADQPALRQDFIAQIAGVKYDEQLPVFLVLSLREDYYASLHEFRSAIPSIFQNNANIRLGAFTDEEAKRAILLPLVAVGLQMEDGLADTIIHDLKQSAPGQKTGKEKSSGIEPITLQIVCHKLWQMKPRDAATMTAAVYEKCGSAQKILRHHVSELLQKIPLRQQGLMVRIFEALKTRDNTKLYRRLQDLQETLRLADSRRLKNALQKLAEIGVLRHEQRSGDDWYEFKHDDLVPEVTKWIQVRREKNNHRWRVYGVTPGLIILIGWLAYLLYHYSLFYAGFIGPEHETQQEEIAIFRSWAPFQQPITTGLLMKDVRDHKATSEIREKLELGLWKRKDWRLLAEELKPDAARAFLYKSGQVQAGLDKFIVALNDKNGDVRSAAISALGNLGDSDDRVIDILIATLKDDNDEHYGVSRKAAIALARLARDNDRARTALVSALEYKSFEVRSVAAIALGNLGYSDDSVIAALVTALGRQTYFVNTKNEATSTLISLAERGDRAKTDKVITALIGALKDEDYRTWSQAVEALVSLGQLNSQVIIALETALQKQSLGERTKVAKVLVSYEF